MKKFLIVLLFPISAFSVEITDTISVHREVTPNIYRMTVEVTCRSKSEKGVIDCLSTADKEIKKLKLFYRGGNFVVYPEREWVPSKKSYVSKGFKGTVYYTFFMKTPKKQDKILKTLNEVQKRAPVHYSVSEVNWIVSPSKKKKIEEALKLVLLRKSLKEAEEFGKALGKKCSVEKVRFEESEFFYPKVESLRVGAPVPKKGRKTINIKAQVKFNCN